jgi:predicted DNA-binding ribbon-helix-helix protein
MQRETVRISRTFDRHLRVRLEIVSWEALYDVAQRKCCAVHALVAEIDRDRGKSSLSAAIRDYVVAYYRESAQHAFDDARRDASARRDPATAQSGSGIAAQSGAHGASMSADRLGPASSDPTFPCQTLTGKPEALLYKV